MATIPADELGSEEDATHAVSDEAGARYELAFNGQEVEITYSTGPEGAIWAVQVDGQPVLDVDTGDPLTLDGYNPTVRHGVRHTVKAVDPGSTFWVWSTPANTIPTAREPPWP